MPTKRNIERGAFCPQARAIVPLHDAQGHADKAVCEWCDREHYALYRGGFTGERSEWIEDLR